MSFKNHFILIFVFMVLWSCNTQQRKLQREQQEALKAQAQVDEQILSKYMKENNISAERTTSGIYYQVIETGLGVLAKDGDSVSIDYEGRLLYGKLFDSSYLNGKPLNIRIARKKNLISGFLEALQLMNIGQRAIFYIPSGLGYRASGNAQQVSINGKSSLVQSIPPNAILVFDIKMREVIP